jgi:hypothetical protein
MAEVSDHSPISSLAIYACNPGRSCLRELLSLRLKTCTDPSTDAFDRYSPIAIFVNIPATIFATAVYEVILRDSFETIAKGHNIHEDGEEGLARHLTKVGTIEQGSTSVFGGRSTEDPYANGKGVSPV